MCPLLFFYFLPAVSVLVVVLATVLSIAALALCGWLVLQASFVHCADWDHVFPCLASRVETRDRWTSFWGRWGGAERSSYCYCCICVATKRRNSALCSGWWNSFPNDIHCYANLRLLIETLPLSRVLVQHTVVTCECMTEGLCVGWD